MGRLVAGAGGFNQRSAARGAQVARRNAERRAAEAEAAETDPTKGVEIVGENTTTGRHQSGAARQKASGGLDSHNEVGGKEATRRVSQMLRCRDEATAEVETACTLETPCTQVW